MTEIGGVLPVLVVPFKKDATIDFESIPRLVEHCLSNEIQGLVIFGLASELYKLTDSERVEILKMLYRKADILIMDEPTAVLTPQETDELLKVMQGFAEKGVGVIFITHKLRYNVCIRFEGNFSFIFITKPTYLFILITQIELCFAVTSYSLQFICIEERFSSTRI